MGYSSVKLSELSTQERVWDQHKKNGGKLVQHYSGSQFHSYAQRIAYCGESLEFEVCGDDLKFKGAQFCRVRYCPICQWRRSLRWKARAYQAIPAILEAFPRYRWLFLTLTVKNCAIEDLRATLAWMHESFKRMTKLKAWCVEGWIKSIEVTKGKDSLAHPHFHCLLMVPPSYFSGAKYISQEKWGSLWQQCLRINYSPVIDVRAIKKADNPAVLIPELLKYQTKEADLIEDHQWLLTLTEQMLKTRGVAVGGVLRPYLRKLEKTEDLTMETEELESDRPSLCFQWNYQMQSYRLDY